MGGVRFFSYCFQNNFGFYVKKIHGVHLGWSASKQFVLCRSAAEENGVKKPQTESFLLVGTLAWQHHLPSCHFHFGPFHNFRLRANIADGRRISKWHLVRTIYKYPSSQPSKTAKDNVLYTTESQQRLTCRANAWNSYDMSGGLPEQQYFVTMWQTLTSHLAFVFSHFVMLEC